MWGQPFGLPPPFWAASCRNCHLFVFALTSELMSSSGTPPRRAAAAQRADPTLREKYGDHPKNGNGQLRIVIAVCRIAQTARPHQAQNATKPSRRSGSPRRSNSKAHSSYMTSGASDLVHLIRL